MARAGQNSEQESRPKESLMDEELINAAHLPPNNSLPYGMFNCGITDVCRDLGRKCGDAERPAPDRPCGRDHSALPCGFSTAYRLSDCFYPFFVIQTHWNTTKWNPERELLKLKQAQSKFRACIENVAEINRLTRLSDLDHIIVDVGTGYFVQKPTCYQTRDQAHKHYAAKVKYIQVNLDTLEETIGKKKDNMGYLVNVMQAKLVQQQQQHQENPKLTYRPTKTAIDRYRHYRPHSK
ncbi:hypothetical protein B0H16DRAFT_1847571 [Mycena metata]|uniref:Prefoldin subunit 5 n=1 Tax=Mycena metata TaxID=1033252 RepID=A0AAD7DKS2_9AGAR|nr:hypothetical protein B0H16DRAFT_1847571 [Mycena metata]